MTEIAYCQPDADYRRALGENQSHLKHIINSPAHYQASKRRRFPVTVNMEIGSALHCKVLEGDDAFSSRFIQKPDDISFATKEGKEWKAVNKGMTILAKEDFRNVIGMSESLFKLDWFKSDQPDYRKYNELSIYWDADGVPCKGRLDRLVNEHDRVLVLDLKTTDSIDYHTFQKKVIGGMNYVFQAAWYAEAAALAFGKPATFIFIAIERAEPWSVGIFEVPQSMMEEGLAQTKRARQLLNQCLQTKQWPGPSTAYNVLDMPPWYQSPVSNFVHPSECLF